MTAPTVHFDEYFSSVGDVWMVWALCLFALALLARRALNRRQWRTGFEFSRDQRGASYALPYLLTFPFYLILCCVMIQATLILTRKMGNVYAAYAAARTAIVWRPSQPMRPDAEDDRFSITESRAKRAAVLAMTPFSSGFKQHRDELYGDIFHKVLSVIQLSDADAELYYQMHSTLAEYSADNGGETSPIIKRLGEKTLAKKEYVKNKLLYAASATEVTIDEESPAWNEDLKVQVTFTMPMHIPIAGRILKSRLVNGKRYVRDISTTVTLPSEAAKSESGRLSIPYDPWKLILY